MEIEITSKFEFSDGQTTITPEHTVKIVAETWNKGATIATKEISTENGYVVSTDPNPVHFNNESKVVAQKAEAGLQAMKHTMVNAAAHQEMLKAAIAVGAICAGSDYPIATLNQGCRS